MTNLPDDLSRRERRILGLLADGYSVAEISAELAITRMMVTTSLHSAYQTIGVTSRAQAMAWVVQHDLTTGD